MDDLECTSTSNSEVEALKDQEYDAQLFGFTRHQFVMAVKTAVEEHVTNYSTALKCSLVRKYPPDHPEKAEVEKRIQKLIKEYCAVANSALTDLESQLAKVMHIPDHVFLPQDAVQRTQYSEEAEQEVDRQLQDLYQRIQRSKVMEVDLHHEDMFLKNLIPALSKKVDHLEQVTQGTIDVEEDILNTVEAHSEIQLDKINNKFK